MEEVKEVLEARKKQLLQMKQDKEVALEQAPKGNLRICCHGNRTQYYYKEKPHDGNGTYLRRRDREFACELAQKEYNQKVLKAVKKELEMVERCLAGYPQVSAENVYENLHKERKKLVVPVRETDEQYVRRWEAVSYQGKGFGENTPEFYTAKKERVRSKSEWIIADLLKQEGVPYRYECPCYLKGIGLVYPDFTVLNVRERKEYYWEHLGMMDDVAYVEKALQKIAMYEQNGIYPGERLILTYETRKNPLSQKMIMHVIEHYFN